MTVQEACAQAFENGRKVGDAEGYARGKAEAYAEAGDLISVKAARDTCQRIFSDPVLIHAVDTTLKNTPAVAAQPVKRGRWETNCDPEECEKDFYCSECEELICDFDTTALYPGENCYYYCPNCGADMRGEGDA